ncbi:polysaccharide lyase [Kitasatospora sp. NPDC096077]|uniref:polysaccharide lyase n=1 Tax=Kitasatospora sp. NPDC096077 TaxID=3155544 RepID=UPI00331756E0
MNRPARSSALAALALLTAAGCATTPARAHPRPTTAAAAPTVATTGGSGTAIPGGTVSWSGRFTGYGTPQWQHAWGVSGQGAWGAGDFSAVDDPTAPDGGPALQVTYGAGSSANTCTDCPNPGGGQFYTDLNTIGLSALAQGPTLDLKYAVRFPTGRDWGKAGKLPGLYGGKIGQESGGTHGAGWSTRYMWRAAKGSPDNGEVYLYTPSNSGPTGYGVDEGLGDWHFQADGRWHTVEQLVNRSTGDITVWYDGRQVHAATGTASGISSIPFGGVLFSTFYGGHDTSWGPASTQQAYFADFSLSAGVQH